MTALHATSRRYCLAKNLALEPRQYTDYPTCENASTFPSMRVSCCLLFKEPYPAESKYFIKRTAIPERLDLNPRQIPRFVFFSRAHIHDDAEGDDADAVSL